MRPYRPTRDVVRAPLTQPITPDEFVTRGPTGVATFANGIGQPGCSTPSGGRWSPLTG